MSDVTVAQFAEVLKVPVDRLLVQLESAGIQVSGPQALISDEAKLELLTHLRRSHGASEPTSKTQAGAAAPRKITRARKTQSELKQASTQGRARTVNVEVRHKKTYIKRDVLEEQNKQLQDEVDSKRKEQEAAEQAERDRQEAARRESERMEAENRRRIEDNTLGLKLRPNQQFALITYLDNSGDSNYHAAQFTLRRRFSTGLGLSMAYTYGKSIDNQSVDPVGASSGGGLSTTNSRTPTDIRDFREERARSDFDRTHVFTGASVWEVPVGRGRKFLNSGGMVNQVLGGWTINTIFTYMTGEPFAVRSGSFTSNGSHEGRAGVQLPVKAELQELPSSPLAGPVLFKPVNPLPCGVDLTQAFCIPAPGQNGPGRNIFTAPSYWNVDFGFIKTFAINERVKLQ